MIANTFTINRPLITIVHFNRIAMQRGEPQVWTVHNSRGCFGVTEVHMKVPMSTVYDPNGKQPRAKFKGRARVAIANGIATLY